MHALDGVRILDLTGGIAGPLGVLQLAEHGADVIKIEPPGGGAWRAEPGSRVHNRSRRSITVDLRTADGQQVFRDLCATADVVVEAFAPGTMDEWGVGSEALRAEHPRLVYCAVPAWPTGSRLQDVPGYEALVHARSGQQHENTSFRDGPVFLHSPVASLAAALLVPTGIMSALLARDRTGKGQHVEVSLFQGVLSLTTQIWNWTDRGQFMLAKTVPAGIHQESIFECANGQWIHAPLRAGLDPTRTEGEIVGFDEVGMAELFTMSPEDRAAHSTKRREAYKRHDRDTLVRDLQAANFGAEAIVAPHERFDHPQLRATGSVVEVEDPEVGTTTQLGQVLFLDATPGEVRGPQPLPGAHTDEVLAELGYDDERLAALRKAGVV